MPRLAQSSRVSSRFCPVLPLLRARPRLFLAVFWPFLQLEPLARPAFPYGSPRRCPPGGARPGEPRVAGGARPGAPARGCPPGGARPGVPARGLLRASPRFSPVLEVLRARPRLFFQPFLRLEPLAQISGKTLSCPLFANFRENLNQNRIFANFCENLNQIRICREKHPDSPRFSPRLSPVLPAGSPRSTPVHTGSHRFSPQALPDSPVHTGLHRFSRFSPV